MPNDSSVELLERDKVDQQAKAGVSDQLRAIYGEDHNVTPPKEQQPGEDLGQELDRVIFNRPGYQESSHFLKKLGERIRRKNPDAQVKLKDQ